MMMMIDRRDIDVVRRHGRGLQRFPLRRAATERRGFYALDVLICINFFYSVISGTCSCGALILLNSSAASVATERRRKHLLRRANLCCSAVLVGLPVCV